MSTGVGKGPDLKSRPETYGREVPGPQPEVSGLWGMVTVVVRKEKVNVGDRIELDDVVLWYLTHRICCL